MDAKTLKLTQTAMFMAIIIAITFIPQVGYITYGPGLVITSIHIPVIIGAIFLGPTGGLILGTTWGITCLVYALIGATPDSVIFLNPLVSVLPRMIVGLATAWYFIVFSKTPAKKLALPLTALCGTLTNTVLVLFAINLFPNTGTISLTGTLGSIVKTVISINGIIEAVGALLLVTIIGRVLLKYKKAVAR